MSFYHVEGYVSIFGLVSGFSMSFTNIDRSYYYILFGIASLTAAGIAVVILPALMSMFKNIS